MRSSLEMMQPSLTYPAFTNCVKEQAFSCNMLLLFLPFVLFLLNVLVVVVKTMCTFMRSLHLLLFMLILTSDSGIEYHKCI